MTKREDTTASIATQGYQPKPNSRRLRPIPQRLNLLILSLSISASAGLLYLASHVEAWWGVALCALGFAYVNNTTFSLLHEAVHGAFHKEAWINNWAGRLASAFFPTSFSIQRVSHLGHHRRNRSDVEQFDYYRPTDSKFLKFAQWYCIVGGLYWLFLPVGNLVYLVAADLARLPAFRDPNSKLAQATSFDAMISGVEELRPGKVRLEILFSLAVQVGLWVCLDLDWIGWASCYAAFAWNWSSLQYADHAWSPLHVHDGAWNMRTGTIRRYFFLNYHFHKVHHQYPNLPWIHLPDFADPDEERPSFWGVYLQMLRGPRRHPDYDAMEAALSGDVSGSFEDEDGVYLGAQ